MAKNALFQPILNKILKPSVNFSRVWTKYTNCWEILRKFSKISLENSKKCISLAYSQQNLKNLREFFARLDVKFKLQGNFEKILQIFDKNSIAKLHFYLFLEKLWLKIEPSEITTFFYNNIFNFVERGRSLCSPLAAPMAVLSIREM